VPVGRGHVVAQLRGVGERGDGGEGLEKGVGRGCHCGVVGLAGCLVVEVGGVECVRVVVLHFLDRCSAARAVGGVDPIPAG
jgi:hypothetical protein